MSLASQHSLTSVADSWLSHHSTGVNSHTVFKHPNAVSALPGGFICTVTARSFLAGMELQVLGCSAKVAAAPICAIPVFHSLSSRSDEYHVLICTVNLVLLDSCTFCGSYRDWLPEWTNRTSVSLCWVCNVSFWSHGYCWKGKFCKCTCLCFILDTN